jgi:hypothetical protein
MKTYIKNLTALAEYTGRPVEEITGEEIGYGERAVVFTDSHCDTLDEFLADAEPGTCFAYEGKMLCKIRLASDDADVVYEDEDGDILQF